MEKSCNNKYKYSKCYFEYIGIKDKMSIRVSTWVYEWLEKS